MQPIYEEEVLVDDEEDIKPESLRGKIIQLLSKKDIPENGLDTLRVAKGVSLKTQKEVNPTLYKLLEEGIIIQIKLNGKSRPHWKMNKL